MWFTGSGPSPPSLVLPFHFNLTFVLLKKKKKSGFHINIGLVPSILGKIN